jgi:hypothetical protein
MKTTFRRKKLRRTTRPFGVEEAPEENTLQAELAVVESEAMAEARTGEEKM